MNRREFLAGALALMGGSPPDGPRLERRAPPGRPAAPIVKAAYLTYYGVGDMAIREQVFGLLEHTELNGIVIDAKGDRGLIPYETRLPLAEAAGAMGPVRIRDFDDMLAGLRRRGLHTIARVVVFKDDVLARHRPEWAVIDTRTGKPWLDREGLAWLDPFKEAAWEHPIAVAREAALKGFDEIQFDYLRFPTDGPLAAARYSRPSTQETRLATVSEFLRRARRALDGTGAALAVDVFGYTAFNTDDTAIGQRIEELTPLVDYLCPMAYPSSYHAGIPGYPNPVAHPYEVVSETVQRLRQRVGAAPVGIRPWLQDFRDYAFDRRPFGPAEVRAEISAAEDTGAAGWMLWNPRNQYTAAALRPKPRPASG